MNYRTARAILAEAIEQLDEAYVLPSGGPPNNNPGSIIPNPIQSPRDRVRQFNYNPYQDGKLPINMPPQKPSDFRPGTRGRNSREDIFRWEELGRDGRNPPPPPPPVAPPKPRDPLNIGRGIRIKAPTVDKYGRNIETGHYYYM